MALDPSPLGRLLWLLRWFLVPSLRRAPIVISHRRFAFTNFATAHGHFLLEVVGDYGRCLQTLELAPRIVGF